MIKNGTLEKKVLQQEPFKTVGSIVELFKDNMDDARKIIGIIDVINKNAEEINGAYYKEVNKHQCMKGIFNKSYIKVSFIMIRLIYIYNWSVFKMILLHGNEKLSIDSYEPCPCGSGNRFKFCCYQKARKIKHEGYKAPEYSDGRINNLINKTWQDTNFKTCLSISSSVCEGTIKNAHAIQNNRILNKISKDNHVYNMKSIITKNGPETTFNKISKNKASTFFGFCDKHDTELFIPIELKEYNNGLEQNFLFAFRAHAIEYHRKLRKLNVTRESFKINPSQMLSSEGVYLYRVAQLDVEDCERDHEKFKRDYHIGNYSGIRTIYRKLNFEVGFAVCSSFAVRYDLTGDTINDIYSIKQKEMPSIYLNLYPVENGTNILISYHINDEEIYQDYFNQLETLSNEELIKYLNYLIIEYTENVFFHPSLIESLNDKQKSSLLRSFQSSINIAEKFDLITLNNYYNFDLFSY